MSTDQNSQRELFLEQQKERLQHIKRLEAVLALKNKETSEIEKKECPDKAWFELFFAEKTKAQVLTWLNLELQRDEDGLESQLNTLHLGVGRKYLLRFYVHGEPTNAHITAASDYFFKKIKSSSVLHAELCDAGIFLFWRELYGDAIELLESVLASCLAVRDQVITYHGLERGFLQKFVDLPIEIYNREEFGVSSYLLTSCLLIKCYKANGALDKAQRLLGQLTQWVVSKDPFSLHYHVLASAYDALNQMEGEAYRADAVLFAGQEAARCGSLLPPVESPILFVVDDLLTNPETELLELVTSVPPHLIESLDRLSREARVVMGILVYLELGGDICNKLLIDILKCTDKELENILCILNNSGFITLSAVGTVWMDPGIQKRVRQSHTQDQTLLFIDNIVVGLTHLLLMNGEAEVGGEEVGQLSACISQAVYLKDHEKCLLEGSVEVQEKVAVLFRVIGDLVSQTGANKAHEHYLYACSILENIPDFKHLSVAADTYLMVSYTCDDNSTKVLLLNKAVYILEEAQAREHLELKAKILMALSEIYAQYDDVGIQKYILQADVLQKALSIFESFSIEVDTTPLEKAKTLSGIRKSYNQLAKCNFNLFHHNKEDAYRRKAVNFAEKEKEYLKNMLAVLENEYISSSDPTFHTLYQETLWGLIFAEWTLNNWQEALNVCERLCLILSAHGENHQIERLLKVREEIEKCKRIEEEADRQTEQLEKDRREYYASQTQQIIPSMGCEFTTQAMQTMGWASTTQMAHMVQRIHCALARKEMWKDRRSEAYIQLTNALGCALVAASTLCEVGFFLFFRGDREDIEKAISYFEMVTEFSDSDLDELLCYEPHELSNLAALSGLPIDITSGEGFSISCRLFAFYFLIKCYKMKALLDKAEKSLEVLIHQVGVCSTLLECQILASLHRELDKDASLYDMVIDALVGVREDSGAPVAENPTVPAVLTAEAEVPRSIEVKRRASVETSHAENPHALLASRPPLASELSAQVQASPL